ncbi:MAG TPA: bifunctional phosphoglucose/phosphomannose isomerase [Candidatus Saccharibacteria bacterium]|jgi:glucose/mannose-6-phosphate isomerase|nr:bifunctional phosphoglucose/phosphomannose isomerase [Candidatus Saccharibacteria bacterium]HMR37951.1 bifunctional phosphoglucose/phosphomannose isomerase [Candidatus Saccharibacteria bacterium]
MLDDINILKQRDPNGVLDKAAELYKSVAWEPEVLSAAYDGRSIERVVVTGMGGSALAARIVGTLTRPWLKTSYEISQDYELPGSIGPSTLVIAISHSGNTEETLAAYDQAMKKECLVAVITSGGQLLERAEATGVTRIVVPSGSQPRMSTNYHLKAILRLLMNYQLSGSHLYDEMTDSATWLRDASLSWHHEVPVHENYAKQIALMSVGKTPVFYSGPLMAALAYKWKISWNENAKNVAFCGQYPEFNHNEFIGWVSHPVEKPFAVVDIWSDLERPRISERMELSDKLLSGKRPRAIRIYIQGDTLLRQFLLGLILADYASIFVAILNNVDPEKVELIERLKSELS